MSPITFPFSFVKRKFLKIPFYLFYQVCFVCYIQLFTFVQTILSFLGQVTDITLTLDGSRQILTTLHMGSLGAYCFFD
jgi:hypothetical protein